MLLMWLGRLQRRAPHGVVWPLLALHDSLISSRKCGDVEPGGGGGDEEVLGGSAAARARPPPRAWARPRLELTCLPALDRPSRLPVVGARVDAAGRG